MNEVVKAIILLFTSQQILHHDSRLLEEFHLTLSQQYNKSQIASSCFLYSLLQRSISSTQHGGNVMLPQHLVFKKLQESPHFRFSMRLNAFRDMLHLQFAQSAIDPFSQNQRLHPTPPSVFQCLTASSIAQCPQKTQHKECVVSLQLSPKAIHNILLPKNNNTILK